jgi:putative nucleotidyltransferase with HDIG domain
MQVANLAMEVADKIGAKSQLARTGALYHDIGKISNPAFFTENQSGVNPHDQLTEVESAQIITAHVTDGLRLAEKYHLPQEIRNFITTHHGAGMAKYFYIQHVNKYPHDAEDKEVFSYPGPNPFTREQAVLMMCDAVEAASRSLKEYTEESIANLVNKIIDGQLADGHFKECPITFKDIADAKQVLIDSLKTIYHTRISYPELNGKSQEPVAKSRQGLFGGGLPGTWRRQS